MFCRKNGIARHKTVRHTPQQNGVAERHNGTIMDRVRCLLSDSLVPKRLRVEFVSYTVFILNRCPHTSINFETPVQRWTKHPPKLDNLRVFVCTSYVHQNQGK